MTLDEALLALGDDVDTVVRTLKEKGIRGERLNGLTCPISNYLTSCGFLSPMVDSLTASGGTDGSNIIQKEALPPAVRTFLQRFDATAFPELEA